MLRSSQAATPVIARSTGYSYVGGFMLADALRTFYAYNDWANVRILDATAHLAPEQLNAPGDAGQRSVRETLLHMMSAHGRWLSSWDGSKSREEARRWNLDP